MKETQEIVTQVTELLRDFASQLGTTVANIFQILTYQARVEGLIGSVVAAIMVIGLLITARLFFVSGKNYTPKDDYDEGKVGRYAGFGVFSLLACIALFIGCSYLLEFLVPQGAALGQLLSLIKR